MDRQLAALRQALLDDGWDTVEIGHFVGMRHPTVKCWRYSVLANKEYMCRHGVNPELLPAALPHIVESCRKHYAFAVSTFTDEHWTGPLYIPAWVAEFLPRPAPPPLSPRCDPKAGEA
jgi:hypothetical protein